MRSSWSLGLAALDPTYERIRRRGRAAWRALILRDGRSQERAAPQDQGSALPPHAEEAARLRAAVSKHRGARSRRASHDRETNCWLAQPARRRIVRVASGRMMGGSHVGFRDRSGAVVAACRRRRGAGGVAAEDRHRDLRRRLLLVRGGRFRQGRGGGRDHLGLYRRPHRQSHLRAGGARGHRSRRGGRDRVRSRQGDLPAAARRVLAQHRSAGEGPPVLRSRQPVSQRDLLSRRRAAPAGGSFEGRRRGPLQAADRDRRSWRPGTFYKAEDYHQDYYLQESAALQFLSAELRARCAARGAVGPKEKK